MKNDLIKSDERVKALGEVFTPEPIVNFMLDQPEIQAKIEDLSATFLEPAAGEGAFLTELLRRKMAAAAKQSDSAEAFEDNSLIALSTLYGIEIMEDNVEMLVMNLYYTFAEAYREGLKPYHKPLNPNVLKSARTIIQANMLQGDTLKKQDANGRPLIFSEWRLIPKKNPDDRQKVAREEFTFEEILEGKTESAGKLTPDEQGSQVDMFAMLTGAPEPETEQKRYAVVPIVEVWQKRLI
ncbi:MAG: hypothetical protein ACI39G_01570 [Pseudoramibacter sp.]